MERIKNILMITGQLIGSILVLLIFFVLPIYAFVSCNNQKHEEYVEYIKEANANPQYYAITYTDGYTDTIQVYKDKFNKGITTNILVDNINVYVRYVPYKKYTEYDNINNDYITIYNILRTKKLSEIEKVR